MKVNYAHLCEKAFLSQNGNLNLIGIFEKMAAHQFPVAFPQLSLVTSLEGTPGEHRMVIQVINKKEQKEMMKSISININVKQPEDQNSSKPQSLRIIGDINNLTIDQAGEYEVQLTLNEKLAYTIPFTVQKAVKAIPEGR